jgi:hypothetical protein
MLVVAAPLLLARQPPRLVLPLVIFGIVGIVSLLMLGADLPLLSRMNELDTRGASGSMWLVVPLNSLIELLSDSSYLFTGTGAGSTTSDLGRAWPILKLTKEYGVVTMSAFVFFYASIFLCISVSGQQLQHPGKNYRNGYLPFYRGIPARFSSGTILYSYLLRMTESVRGLVKSYYTEGQVNYV